MEHFKSSNEFFPFHQCGATMYHSRSQTDLELTFWLQCQASMLDLKANHKPLIEEDSKRVSGPPLVLEVPVMA